MRWAHAVSSHLRIPSVVCSNQIFFSPIAFAYSVPREPLTHKAAVFYHQQLALQEDQGIDLTQSPGRDSPGSSSGSAGSSARYSRTSLDSGRASTYNPQSPLLSVGPVPRNIGQNLNVLANRVGSLAISGGGGCGGSNSSGCGSLTSPRCSVSSSSIGSVDRISQRSVVSFLKHEEYLSKVVFNG